MHIVYIDNCFISPHSYTDRVPACVVWFRVVHGSAAKYLSLLRILLGRSRLSHGNRYNSMC